MNVYILMQSGGPIMVDSGWASEETHQELARNLRQIGVEVGDITQCLVTHAHYDHYTEALALRPRWKARIRLGRGEQFSVCSELKINDPHARQVAMLQRCGADRLAEEYRQFVVNRVDDAPFGPPDEWLDDDEEISLDRGNLKVMRTPGHTRGHIVLAEEERGLLFAGDHVLPHITPSLGYEREPEVSPLRSYLSSLRLVRQGRDKLLLPAHGPVAQSSHTRIDEILAHHAGRLASALQEVASGATTAFEVASGHRWTRRELPLDRLHVEHRAIAVLEIEAHLHVLVEDGALRVEASGDGVTQQYEIA